MFGDRVTPPQPGHARARVHALGLLITQAAIHLRPGMPIEHVPSRSGTRFSSTGPDR